MPESVAQPIVIRDIPSSLLLIRNWIYEKYGTLHTLTHLETLINVSKLERCVWANWVFRIDYVFVSTSEQQSLSLVGSDQGCW